MTLYSLENIKKKYGEKTILNIDHLVLEEGRAYALTGPNGAGKTTLLHVLAFLLEPTSGVMTYKGVSVHWGKKIVQRLRREVVLVDQYPILFTAPVWKNIDFGLKIRRVPEIERKKIIWNVLELVGMEKFYEADARKLSGGETKRVALARALAIEPQVLLCDEPTANVDKENLDIILQILKKYNQERQATLVFATHLHDQGERLADEAIALKNGTLCHEETKNVFQGVCLGVDAGLSQWKLGPQLIVNAAVSDASPGMRKAVYLQSEKISFRRVSEKKNENIVENIWYGQIKKIEKSDHGVALTVDASIEILLSVSYQKYRNNNLHIDTLLELSLVCNAADLFVKDKFC